MTNTSILAAFERMWQHIVHALSNKANVVHTHNVSEIDGLESVGNDCDMLIQMEHHLHGTGLEENITKEDFTIIKGNVSDVMLKWKNKEVVKICLLARWYYEDDGWHYDLYEATAINMILDDNETYGYYLEANFECGGNSVLLDLRSETNSVENVYVRCRRIVTTKPYSYKEGQVAISDGNGGITWSDNASSNITIVRWE